MAASSASGSGSRSLLNILHSTTPSSSTASSSSSARAVWNSSRVACHCQRRCFTQQSSSICTYQRRSDAQRPAALSRRSISTTLIRRKEDELSAAITEDTENVNESKRPASLPQSASSSSNRNGGAGEENWLDNFLSTDLFSGATSKRKSTKPETITLEEFHKFQPSPKSIKINSNFAPHVRERLKSQRMWQIAYNNVYNGYNVQQLLSLAQQAGITIKGKKKASNNKKGSNPRKAELVSMMIKHEFKLSNPDDKPAPPEASFKKSFLISRTALFLLLAGSGRLIAQLAVQFGIDLRPEMKANKQDDKSAGPPLFYIAASGDKEVIENQFSEALEKFVQSIRSDTFALDIPFEHLESDAIQQISQQTVCAIKLDHPIVPSSPTSTTHRSLRLSATNDFDILRAKTLLSSMQARYFQPTPLHLSYATPSPLDADYVENPNEDLTLYGFLPTLPHSSMLPTLKSMFGERSSSLFRLARVRRAAWARNGQQINSDKISLVDTQDEREPLGTARNWDRVDDNLSLSDWQFDSKVRAASLPGSTTAERHSLQFGQLLYPSRSHSDEMTAGPESQILQQVFGAPLNGSWTLDTAYEWFKGQNGREDNGGIRPVWTPSLLPGSAIDSAASHSPHLELWMKGTAAQEGETIRLTYWVRPAKQGEAIDIDQVVRLEVDIAEIEEFVNEPEQTDNVSSENSVDAEDAGGLDDLLGGAPPSGTEKDNTGRPQRRFRYEINSARWIKAKQANVCAPDHGVDLRLENEVDLPVNVDVLPLQEYLDALTASVSSPSSSSVSQSEATPTSYSVQRREDIDTSRRSAVNQRYTTQAVSSESNGDTPHPRLSNEPVPTLSSSHSNAFPPLKLNVKGLECNFESVKRVYTSRWELNEAEQQADVQAYLVNETSLDGNSSNGNITQSRTSIQWEYLNDEKGTWRSRMDSVKGLLKPLVIGS